MMMVFGFILEKAPPVAKSLLFAKRLLSTFYLYFPTRYN